jgi:HK97 family phage portal protein
MVSVVSKWFGKKQVVARKRYVPEGATTLYQSFVHILGKPVWTAREYQRFADEAYGKNVIAHLAISLVAQGAAGVPWLLYHNKDIVSNHPILTLLNHPNPHLNGAQFIENLITYRMISGNAYVLAIGAEGGAPLELHLLRPDSVQVIAGKNGHAMGYQYQTERGCSNI